MLVTVSAFCPEPSAGQVLVLLSNMLSVPASSMLDGGAPPLAVPATGAGSRYGIIARYPSQRRASMLDTRAELLGVARWASCLHGPALPHTMDQRL